MTLIDFLTRLGVALLCGGILGMERQVNGRPAGLRTHVMVCTGACIAVSAGLTASGSLSLDTGRIAAGVITGVGFLGAGTIVHYREGVGGLTTASCIWFVAMTGIMAGFGLLLQAGIATITALAILVLLDLAEDRMHSASYWELKLSFENRDFSSADSASRELLEGKGIVIKSSTAKVTGGQVELAFILRTRFWKKHRAMIDSISALEGIRSVEWAHRTEAM